MRSRYGARHSAMTPAQKLVVAYAKMVKDPENATLSRCPMKPVLPTTLHKTKATFGFSFSPTYREYGLHGTNQVGGQVAQRTADIVAVLPYEQSFDGGVCAKVLVPSSLAESVQLAIRNGQNVFQPPLNFYEYYTNDTAPDTTLLHCRGFGSRQSRVDQVPDVYRFYDLPIQETPFSARCTVVPQDGKWQADGNNVREQWFWDSTIVRLSSSITYPNSVITATESPNDNSSFRPEVTTPSGSYAPYIYKCKITGLPTTERFTTIRAEHYDKPLPDDWLNVAPFFSGYGGTGPLFNTTQCGPQNSGFNPLLYLEMLVRETGSSSNAWTIINQCANPHLPNGMGFFGYDLSDRVTGDFIQSLNRVQPSVRMIAQEIQAYLLGDQNSRSGEVHTISLQPHPDHFFLAPSDLILHASVKTRPVTSVDAKRPARLFFSIENPDEQGFWPNVRFGNASTAWGAIIFVGLLGGDLNLPSVLSTIRPVNIRVQMFGVSEKVDEIQGETTVDATDLARACGSASANIAPSHPAAGVPMVVSSPGPAQVASANAAQGSHPSPASDHFALGYHFAPGGVKAEHHRSSGAKRFFGSVGRGIGAAGKFVGRLAYEGVPNLVGAGVTAFTGNPALGAAASRGTSFLEDRAKGYIRRRMDHNANKYARVGMYATRARLGYTPRLSIKR